MAKATQWLVKDAEGYTIAGQPTKALAERYMEEGDTLIAPGTDLQAAKVPDEILRHNPGKLVK